MNFICKPISQSLLGKLVIISHGSNTFILLSDAQRLLSDAQRLLSDAQRLLRDAQRLLSDAQRLLSNTQQYKSSNTSIIIASMIVMFDFIFGVIYGMPCFI